MIEISNKINDKIDVPRHIAIIMDGNGRWAKERKLSRIEGHRRGVETVRNITEFCGKIGLKKLTLYTFSSENWKRPIKEISALMALLVKTIRKEVKNLNNNNVRFTTVGDTNNLPRNVKQELIEAIESTESNTGLNLNLAINYGGRQEIAEVCKRLSEEVIQNIIIPDDITETYMNTKFKIDGNSDPDLLIRTGGEFRISNFMLWQIAYTEFFVTDVFWPDFNKDRLLIAINDYNNRERRFGKTSEQI